MFPNGELLVSLSPDEVLALGAASQASLLNEPWLEENANERESEPVITKLTATAHAISYAICFYKDELEQSAEASAVTLIPAGVAIPTRRSNHLTDTDVAKLEGNNSKLVAKFFMKSQDEILTLLTEVNLFLFQNSNGTHLIEIYIFLLVLIYIL